MSEKNKALEQQFYTPPPKVGRWESFKLFLWNSETSQFLGRTGASWGKILVFYLIFYLGLAGFFGAMLAVFYQTLDNSMPKWQLDQSLIGSTPGLGFRPMPPESLVDSTLIWYNTKEEKNLEHWVHQLDKFLEEYRKKHPNWEQCEFERPPQQGRVCLFDVDQLHPCTKNERYNYPKSGPCIFLKLNKIYGWRPDYYNDSKALPEDMPDDLKLKISSYQSGEKRLNTVWVSCQGENAADVENIGPINYQPERGFPGYYFPYLNVPGYLSPLVAVNFERPRSGVLINIECKAWAHNIRHDRAEQRGSVHFELMVD